MTMRRAPVAICIALVAVLAVAAAPVACSPFSGSDVNGSTDAGAAASSDGPNGGANADGAAAFDFDTCPGLIHVTQGFEGTTFPPQDWRDESYPAGGVGREQTAVNTGSGSMKAHVVTDAVGRGALIGYSPQNASLVPRGVRVRFAYRTVAAGFKGMSLYAEVGCEAVWNQSDTNNFYVGYSFGKPEIGLADSNSDPAIGFTSDAWFRVSQELRLDTSAGQAGPVSANLLTTLAQIDGGTGFKGALSAQFKGTLPPLEIVCGIPFALDPSPKSLDVYVDDIEIDICP